MGWTCHAIANNIWELMRHQIGGHDVLLLTAYGTQETGGQSNQTRKGSRTGGQKLALG